jgi:transcriptional regulator with AAA-type ATPase domain
VSAVQSGTQTEEQRVVEEVPLRATSVLTRFFRADSPFDDVSSFSLARSAHWELGRIDCRPSSLTQSRIWTLGDVLMSSRHAVVSATPSGYQIRDVGSKNGTFVNGLQLTSPHLLRHGDVIECGRSFFVYRVTTTQPAVPLMAPPAPLEVAPFYHQIEPLLPYVSLSSALHLHGETGTGKEVAAQAVHALSGRTGRFVAINCAAIPENLFESEMFGHRRGAFSGAGEPNQGAVLAARGGTLFLDEIAELPLVLQAKLLRVIETKTVVPLGGQVPVPVDFRLISATLTDVRALVEQGAFRRDLFARLGHIVEIGALRDHREELGLVIQLCLAALLGKRMGAPLEICFSLEAARALVLYRWPFNIRELKQCIENALMRALAEHVGPKTRCMIELRHLPTVLQQDVAEAGSRAAAALPSELERTPALSSERVLDTLRQVDGNRARAAELLGVSERTVYRKLSKLRGRQDEDDTR